jgi:hypothetical protein
MHDFYCSMNVYVAIASVFQLEEWYSFAAGCFFSREHAKALCFDALIEKKVICTSPKPDEHHAVQLDPRKGNLV